MRVLRHRLLATVTLGACAVLSAPALALDGPMPGAVSASKLKLPDGPGSVHGLAESPQVDVFTGQVGYAVPIDLPKGPAGFGPSIGLTYSGSLGNSALGVGWTMEPIHLRRTLRHGVPTYTDADELELVGIGGGGRLVADPGHAGQYWVEGQGARLHAVRHDVGFEITDGSGTHYFLGRTQQSRVQNGDDKVAVWMAELVVDVAGQEIHFNYRRETGQLYLDNVTWGPPFTGGQAFRVAFIYDARPDDLISYATGFGVQTQSRLRHVDVWAFGVVLRTYDLVYADQAGDLSFSISRLHSIEMHGRGGVGALPKLTFRYAGLDLHDTEEMPGTGGWVVNQRGVTFADVDGDGASDLLRLEMGNYRWRKSRGTEFAGDKPISGAGDFDLDSAALIDVNGDARPELVHVVDDTWRVFKLVGQSWQSMGAWPGTAGLPIHDGGVAALADVNGDGLVDVIRARTGGIGVNFNSPTGMGPTVSLPRVSPSDVTFEPGAAGVRFTDMNGDGLADAVWMTDAWIKIFLGRGDGTFVPFDRVPYPWGTAALDPVAVQLADLNRDGLTDLVRIVDGQAQWYPGLASLHFTAVPRRLRRPDGATSDSVITITDANGNGSQDVVWSTPGGIWIQDLAGATSAGMLTTIDNGLGAVVNISYTSSAALAIAADLRGEPWQQNLPVAVPVPTRTETNLGAGFLPRVLEHSVRDGFWDGSERRFGGFLQGLARSLAADPTRTLEVETRFHQGIGNDRVLRGKSWYARRASAAGVIFDLEQKTFETRTVAGLPTNQPLARKAAMTSASTFYYEGGASPVETRANFYFDDQVRPIEEDHLGVPSISGDEKIVQHVYASDTVSVRDLVCEETVREAGVGQAVVSHLRRYYTDGSNNPLPFGAVGNGWVALVQNELLAPDGTGRWIPQSSFAYDAVGNPVAVTENGVTRDLTYDLQLFPQTETIRGTAPLLAWSATWDRVFGQIATLTDPNGDVTAVGYDTLGRVETSAINGASPHVHYAYDWSAPSPKTTTWVFDGNAGDLSTEGPTWPAGSHWRSTVGVANGAGESLYTVTQLGTQFIVAGWKERDERGQVVRVAEPFASNVPAPLAPAVGTRIQLVDHDALARATLQTLPNGATKHVVYRPLGQTVESADLGPVTTETDGLGRMVRTVRNATDVEVMTARFDAADRITQIDLQYGAAVHRYEYDSLGRLRFATDPDIGDRNLEYNDANLLTVHTNGAGQSVYFDYDAAGRLVRRGDAATPAPGADYAYVYDVDPLGGSGCHTTSRLASVQEPSEGEVHFCYDALGRQTQMNRTIAAFGAPTTGGVSQTLSLSGLLLGETFDDGFALTYQYDGAGRAKAVASADGPLWTADSIDPAGRVVTEHYGNGAIQSYGYDALGLPSQVKVDRPAGAGTLYDVTVERNAYGAPTIVTDHDGQGLDQNATFAYDPGGRLTGATVGISGPQQYQFTYRYDALQNMIQRGVVGPQDIGVLAGSYRYGERGYGPRQLTSVVPGGTP